VALALLAPSACGGAPNAQDLWDRPAHSGVKDAHASIAGSGRGVTFDGDGEVVFQPRLAMSLHLQTRSGAMPAELDVLKVNGTTYERAGSDQKWARGTTSPPDPTWEGGVDPRLVGQDTVAGRPAWHLSAVRGSGALEMWVRTADGYPVKVVTTNRAGSTFTFRFDRFNSGSLVQAPSALEVKSAPRRLMGRVGDLITLGEEVRVAVLSFDDDARPDDDAILPRPGNRFVVIEVQVDNVSTSLVSTFFNWRLTDAAGFAWARALGVRSPAFMGSELGPGGSDQGFLTYEVSRSSSGLILSVKVDDDTAAITLA
jgi:hypothetical protein